MIRRAVCSRATAFSMQEASHHSSPKSGRRPFEEPRSRVERGRPGSSPDPVTRPLIRPSKEYLELSSQQASSSNDPARSPKLLVLDLNGALIYRSKNGSGGGKRPSFPRPYLPSFLQYLFAPERDGSRRPWEAFVWSSAQPDNVRAMVELGFGKNYTAGIWSSESYENEMERKKTGAGKLLGVWARDKMGLTASQYNNKTQTTKDLCKVFKHFAPQEMEEGRWSPSAPTARSSASPEPWPFSEANSLLLDDSPLKAVYQPFNQLVIPEFDRQEYRDSVDGLLAAEDGFETSAQVDSILLGVIGILEALKTVDNVPAWIRAGGLFPEAAGPARVAHGTLKDEHLPSHPDFTHWFASPAHLRWWIARGKDALQAKGIELEHGLTLRSQNQLSKKEYSDMNRNGPRSPQRRRSPDYHGNGESSHGSRATRGAAGIVGLAAVSVGSRDDHDQEEETTPVYPLFPSTSPLYEAVQVATATIHRVMGALPPLQNVSAQTLLDACELLKHLIPDDYVPLADNTSDSEWSRERKRVVRACKAARQSGRPGFDPRIYANKRPVVAEAPSESKPGKKKDGKAKRRARRAEETAVARVAAEKSGKQEGIRTRSAGRMKQD